VVVRISSTTPARIQTLHWPSSRPSPAAASTAQTSRGHAAPVLPSARQLDDAHVPLPAPVHPALAASARVTSCYPATRALSATTIRGGTASQHPRGNGPPTSAGERPPNIRGGTASQHPRGNGPPTSGQSQQLAVELPFRRHAVLAVDHHTLPHASSDTLFDQFTHSQPGEPTS
jgi:hypothetical protein